uniref:LacI family DNA-binding transcriptional regulator n=1 Tax=Streptomyces sp. SS7 TaxID=3108485 RepID=UPI00404030C7
MAKRIAERDRPTLTCIAKAAGVSVATVSKVVDGRRDVSPGTRLASRGCSWSTTTWRAASAVRRNRYTSSTWPSTGCPTSPTWRSCKG